MPNWWNRNLKEKQTFQSSWLFAVEATVRVPETEDEEKDKAAAHNVLKTVLNKVEGDTSLYTAIDSNIQFQIQFEPIKR